MSSAGNIGYAAHDATVATVDNAEPARPLTAAEMTYLEQRVDETAAAIKKIDAVIAGAKETLKSARQEHAEAVKALKAAGGGR